MENMIIARFKDNETAAETDKLRQWNYGQTLRIEGLSLPRMVEVHFSLYEFGGAAERQIGTTKEGITDVSIPDKMLENKHCTSSEYTIYAWVYLSDGTSGHTEYDIRIPVETRSRPVDFAPPNQPDFAGQVMEKLIGLEAEKLTRPDTVKVGQIFRVKAISEDGTLVLEAVDMPSGGAVDDVQIDGQSIVSEGVAEIPIAGISKAGVMAVNGNNMRVININGIPTLYLFETEKSWIDNRWGSGRHISPAILDYAVKCAMCDGKGAEWTADEQAMARERMGILEGYELIIDATIEEEVSMHEFTLPKPCSDVLVFVELGDGAEQGDIRFTFFNDFFATIKTPYFYLHVVSLGDKIKKIDSFAQTEINLSYGGNVSTRFLKLSEPMQKTDFFRSYYTFGVGANIKIWGR